MAGGRRMSKLQPIRQLWSHWPRILRRNHGEILLATPGTADVLPVTPGSADRQILAVLSPDAVSTDSPSTDPDVVAEVDDLLALPKAVVPLADVVLPAALSVSQAARRRADGCTSYTKSLLYQ